MSTARALAHKHGRQLLRSGAYCEAVHSLEQTMEIHGPHVGLHCDLALAAYLAGDIAAFRRFVIRLELEFAHARPRLCEQSRILTQISLAKFLEKLGRIAEAYDLIDLTLERLSPGHELEFQVRAEKLRLLVAFGQVDEIAPLYRDCLYSSERNPEQLIECFPSLVLAEARLVGFASAWARLLSLGNRADIFPSELHLCAMDLLELALETEQEEAVARILAFLPALKNGPYDTFECELISLANDCPAASEEDFLRWANTVSPLGHLRLLALESKREGGANQAACDRLNSQLESFDRSTQHLFRTKWRTAFLASETTDLEVNEESHSIRSGDKTVSFGDHSEPWHLLRVLSENAELPPQKILAALDKCDGQPEHESLRIQLLRLNRKLAPLTGFDWVVRYSKHGVRRNPRVRLHFV